MIINKKIYYDAVVSFYQKCYVPVIIVGIVGGILFYNSPFYLVILSSSMSLFFLPIILLTILKAKKSPYGEYILLFLICLLNIFISWHGNLNVNDMVLLIFFNILITSLMIMIIHQSVEMLNRLIHSLNNAYLTQDKKFTSSHFSKFKGSLGISIMYFNILVVPNSIIAVLLGESLSTIIVLGGVMAMFLLFLLEVCRMTMKFSIKYSEVYIRSRMMIELSKNRMKKD